MFKINVYDKVMIKTLKKEENGRDPGMEIPA